MTNRDHIGVLFSVFIPIGVVYLPEPKWLLSVVLCTIYLFIVDVITRYNFPTISYPDKFLLFFVLIGLQLSYVAYFESPIGKGLILGSGVLPLIFFRLYLINRSANK